MKKRTTQLLAELRTLAGQASENLYRRIELAATVLSDLDWIANIHGGSDLKAQDALQDEYFADLGGYVTLGKLVLMFQKLPRDEWESCRWNVAAIEVLYDAQIRETSERGERTSWKAVAEERGKQLETVRRDLDGVHELSERQRSELDELRAKVQDLTIENANLRGRLEQLEKFHLENV